MSSEVKKKRAAPGGPETPPSARPVGRFVRRSDGYVYLGKRFIERAFLDMFDAMKNSNRRVAEHRWVVAKSLGRPLHNYENVDHRDGDKQNNDLDNLRVYIKGKNQEGSCPGYGTYYDEWQHAEAELRLLRQPAVFSAPVCAGGQVSCSGEVR